MPDFDVQLQRTLTLNATITMTAEDEDEARDAVQALIEHGEFGTIAWHVVEASSHPEWEEDGNKMAGEEISVDSVYRA